MNKKLSKAHIDWASKHFQRWDRLTLRNKFMEEAIEAAHELNETIVDTRRLGEEIADVVLILNSICYHYSLDMEKEIENKLKELKSRKTKKPPYL